MPAQWLSNHSESGARLFGAAVDGVRSLAQPERARRVRQLLLLLVALWGIAGLSRLIWALWPAPEAAEPPPDLLNPVSAQSTAASAPAVDIERLVGWHLFGEAEALPAEAVVALEQEALANQGREGIEDGARETRLALTLRGVVAATDDGLGHAIIEHNRQQAVYAVEDKLPVAGRVFLAKVMPHQVVLDNAGTYELLPLYEESDLSREAERAQAATPQPTQARPSAAIAPNIQGRGDDRRGDGQASRMAANYRERLYTNPQSLTQVVQVSAVREQGQLLGYRIQPGRDAEQFEKLGFQSGDLVVGVNGIALDDPANTMRLYQVMRSAQEAVFELQRGGEIVTLSVTLDSGEG